MCSYDLEGAPLYSVKWYRGRFEFYRHTPKETPQTKVFHVQGINVDTSRSNSRQVVLTDIDFSISGNFSCEVTIDDTFATKIDTQTMIVVQLPEYAPKISVGREPLDYGDILRANCSSPPAKPPATLKFFLNNIPVAWSVPVPQKKDGEPIWSDLPLQMILSDFHYDNGRLILKCIAEITDVYFEESELELSSAHNPVPQKYLPYAGGASNIHHRSLLASLFLYVFIFIFS